MKKLVVLSLTAMFLIGIIAPTTLLAEEELSNSFLHITIKNLNSDKVKTDIKVPLALIEWAMQMDHSSMDIDMGDNCKIDWNQFAKALQKMKNNFLIEVKDYESDEHIKIWIE